MSSPKEPFLVIEAGGGRRQFLKDLWEYRELFLFLSWRDILVRYKQTVLGVLWSVLRPLLTIMVFTLVFGRLAKLPAQGVPYAGGLDAAAADYLRGLAHQFGGSHWTQTSPEMNFQLPHTPAKL